MSGSSGARCNGSLNLLTLSKSSKRNSSRAGQQDIVLSLQRALNSISVYMPCLFKKAMVGVLVMKCWMSTL